MQPLDADVVTAKFAALADEIAQATGQPRTPRQVAEGFLQIAVANMANAIKQVSVQKGHDATRFALQCFGGAGGQHACLVADALGMETVFIHPFAGVLSAYGMGLADQTVMREQAVEIPLEPHAMAELRELADRLADEATAALAAQGADPARITAHRTLHLRYAGTEAALIVPLRGEQEIVADFTAAHRARFGFATPDRPAGGRGGRRRGDRARRGGAGGDAACARQRRAAEPIDTIQIFTGDKDRTAPVFDRTDLLAGDRIAGPALIREANATTVVEPGWTAEITALDHMIAAPHRTRCATRVAADSGRPDPVLLELFNNLFMNVAEQTGAVLQNTSMSVNIKERLDFSCAIFDARGLPGGERAARAGASRRDGRERAHRAAATAATTLKPGDVVALNNPFNGGTHLPDVTVITPVFDEAGAEIMFFVGSRGHHADIGGITPGSTPPASRTLEEEGVVIDDFLLVDGGHFREAGIARAAGRREISGAQSRRERRRHQGAGRGEREGRAGTAARRRAVRLADGQRLHAPRDGQCRGVGAPGDRPHRQRRVRLHHGQRTAAARRGQRRSCQPQRGGGLHRHRPAERGQLQLAARGDARRGAVRVPHPGGRRHPAERRLPEAAAPDHPAGHLPVARRRARRWSPATPRSRRPPATRCSVR